MTFATIASILGFIACGSTPGFSLIWISVVFAGSVLLVMPFTLMLASRKLDAAQVAAAAKLPSQSIRQALTEAFQHRSYVLLVLGFYAVYMLFCGLFSNRWRSESLRRRGFTMIGEERG